VLTSFAKGADDVSSALCDVNGEIMHIASVEDGAFVCPQSGAGIDRGLPSRL